MGVARSRSRRRIDEADVSRVLCDDTVSAEDRVAARRSLWRFLQPAAAALTAKNDATYLALLHTIAVLIDVAAPLPPPLERHLTPWIAELRRRRLQIVVDNRHADRAIGAESDQSVAAPNAR